MLRRLPTALLIAGAIATAGARGLLAEGCWKCHVNIEPPIATYCIEVDEGGRDDCSQNMSQTWCSVEAYDPCPPHSPLAVLSTGAARAIDNPVGSIPKSATLVASPSGLQQLVRACSGVIVWRTYDAQHAQQLRNSTAVIAI